MSLEGEIGKAISLYAADKLTDRALRARIDRLITENPIEFEALKMAYELERIESAT